MNDTCWQFTCGTIPGQTEEYSPQSAEPSLPNQITDTAKNCPCNSATLTLSGSGEQLGDLVYHGGQAHGAIPHQVQDRPVSLGKRSRILNDRPLVLGVIGTRLDNDHVLTTTQHAAFHESAA